jgi:uncharacterized protein (DUF2147 family)
MMDLVSETVGMAPTERTDSTSSIGGPRKHSLGGVLLRGLATRLGTSLTCVLSTALLVTSLSMAVPASADSAGVPEGVWRVDPDSALQIFDCSSSLCGRVVWLRHAHDPTGLIQRDKNNPDPSSRSRLVCGMTVLWALRPAGSDKWLGGWFYNPDDGETYSVSAELRSSDLLVARIYRALPIFGKTKSLLRVPRLSSEGWC